MVSGKKKAVISTEGWYGEKVKLFDSLGIEGRFVGEMNPALLEAELPTADAVISGLRSILRSGKGISGSI